MSAEGVVCRSRKAGLARVVGVSAEEGPMCLRL